jgi:uncharacterized low-complexity protein
MNKKTLIALGTSVAISLATTSISYADHHNQGPQAHSEQSQAKSPDGKCSTGKCGSGKTKKTDKKIEKSDETSTK